MKDYEKDVIDSLIKNKPGEGNVERKEPAKKDYIVMVVDRSGSMMDIKTDSEGGINSFIKDQQDLEGKALFTMVEFDTEYDVVYEKVDINEVKKYVLHPRGMTAMRDAIGKALAEVDDVQVDGAKMVVIVTDGHENASREWTKEQMLSRITKLKEKDWDFIFLAANQDALESGSDYGFDRKTTLNFTNDSVMEGYKAASVYALSRRAGRTRSSAVADMDGVIHKSSKLSSVNLHKSQPKIVVTDSTNANTTLDVDVVNDIDTLLDNL